MAFVGGRIGDKLLNKGKRTPIDLVGEPISFPDMVRAIKTGDLPLIQKLWWPESSTNMFGAGGAILRRMASLREPSHAYRAYHISASLSACCASPWSYCHRKKMKDGNAFLKMQGANPMTALHIACNEGQEEVAKWLVSKKKVSTEVRDSQMWFPLHIAASTAMYDTVIMLIKAKCNVNARNSDRTAALHYIVRKNFDEKSQRVVDALIKHGALIDAKNRFDETPLQSAVGRNKMKMCEYLLKQGAQVNAVNKFGETALMKSVAIGNEAIAQLLLENGADPTIKSAFSQIGDPMLVAQRETRSIMVSLLEEYNEKWREKHHQENPENARWATLSTEQRLKESVLVDSSFATLPANDLASYAALCDKPQVEAWDGWIVESNVPNKPHTGPYKVAHKATLYKDAFVNRDHVNFMGTMTLGKDAEPFIVSVVKYEHLDSEYQTMLWNVRGTETMYMPMELLTGDSAKKVSKYLREYYMERYAHMNQKIGLTLEVSPETVEVTNALAQLEENDPQMPRTMTVGVLYAQGHQTEEEDHFHNSYSDTSSAFRKFLKLLGRKIRLEGHLGYRGDLDISGKNLTGKHSYYHRDFERNIEVMYHVAPLIPSEVDEEGQQIVRKRFIGNDITCIVFQDGGCYPAPIRSQFLHIYFIVSPIDVEGKLHYKITVVRKESVPEYGPEVCAPSVILDGEAARNFILTKLINGHLQAMRSPKLTQMLVLGSKKLLGQEVVEQFAKEGPFSSKK